jgi:hypothetical protein
MSFYGFTQDNTKRPLSSAPLSKGCIDAVMKLANHDASLLVVGKHQFADVSQRTAAIYKKGQIRTRPD